MNSVGIDLHRRRSHVAVIDEEGTEMLSRRITNDPATFLELLAELRATPGSPWRRPTAGSGSPTLLQDAGYELHLAHPLRTKAIASARVKTDAVDARALAYLLRADLLPEAYIAPRSCATYATVAPPGRARQGCARRSRTVSRRSSPRRDRAPRQRHVRGRRPALPRRARAARGAAPEPRQPARAGRRLRPRDRPTSREIEPAPRHDPTSRCSARSAASAATSRCS